MSDKKSITEQFQDIKEAKERLSYLEASQKYTYLGNFIRTLQKEDRDKLSNSLWPETKEGLLKKKRSIERQSAYFGCALARATSEDEIKINKFCLKEAAQALRDISKQLESIK